MTSPDGHMYGLAALQHYNLRNNPWVWAIRKDWLGYLKLEEPQTLDDWYKVLTAIRDGDPNKNGQKDEIPMVFESGLKGLSLWGRSWGLHFTRSNGFYPDENGKIQYEWIDSRAKEFITWARKMYDEKLIDQEFLNVENEQYTAKINRNIAGSISNGLNSTMRSNENLVKSGVADAKYIPTLPASGVEGIKPIHENRSPLSDYYSITKDCKDTALVMKWIDFVYASEPHVGPWAGLMPLG
jgi:putative aldouronate transport system substrate-binding protein